MNHDNKSFCTFKPIHYATANIPLAWHQIWRPLAAKSKAIHKL